MPVLHAYTDYKRPTLAGAVATNCPCKIEVVTLLDAVETFVKFTGKNKVSVPALLVSQAAAEPFVNEPTIGMAPFVLGTNPVPEILESMTGTGGELVKYETIKSEELNPLLVMVSVPLVTSSLMFRPAE